MSGKKIKDLDLLTNGDFTLEGADLGLWPLDRTTAGRIKLLQLFSVAPATVRDALELGTAALAAAGDFATPADVADAIADLVASSPAALDTLNELAAALGDDANFASTMTTALAGKQPLSGVLTTLSGASANGQSLVTAADYAAMKVLLALTIGTNVQAWSAVLDTAAALAANKFLARSSAGAAAAKDISDFVLSYMGSATKYEQAAITKSRICVAADGAGWTVPADTTEDVLATITLPVLTAKSQIWVNMLWTLTNSAGTKTPRIRLGGAAGSVLHSPVGSVQNLIQSQVIIANRNATNSQVAFTPLSANSYTAVGAAAVIATSAVDTSIAQDLVISGQKSNSADAFKLEYYTVEVVNL